MDTPSEDAPLLDKEHLAFLGMGVSVNVASRGPDSTPLVGRSCGCRATADGRQVTVFLSSLRTPTLVEALADTGAVAVAISQPSTHRTLQLKGTDARVAPVSDDDRLHFATFRQAFAAELAALGYALDFAAAVVPEVDGGLVAVRFTPTAAFDQTPGHNAGKPLQTS
jgi:hypothetical protein